MAVARVLVPGALAAAFFERKHMQKNLPGSYSYPAVFVYSKDSEIAVDFPDLGVATSGVSEEDAVLSAKELFGIAILGLEEDCEKIPEPTPIRNIKTKENERASLIEVYMPPIRLRKKQIYIPLIHRKILSDSFGKDFFIGKREIASSHFCIWYTLYHVRVFLEEKSMRKIANGIALATALSMAFTVPVFAGDTFIAKTYVNGIKLDGYTAASAKEYLEGEFSQNYTMAIKFRNGKTESIKGADIGFKLTAPNNLETILAGQDGQTEGAAAGYTGDGMSATFDEAALRNVLSNMDSIKNAKKTENAYISSTKPYKIVPEVQGDSYDMDKLIYIVKCSLNSGLQSIDLNDYDVMDAITVKSGDLQETLTRLNQIGDISVTLNVLGHKETVDSNRITDWMTGFENGQPVLDQNKVAAYVAEIANRYDDSGNTQTFHSASGKDVVMSTNYGVHIDKAATVTSLTNAIAGLQTTEIEPVYTCKPLQYDMPQFGNTFVEVDITLQHVYFYQDNQCVWDSDCVTGTATDSDKATPTGIYSLTYKARDRVLRGKKVNGKYSYESPVSYWMPFNGGIGLHDATWRSKFGGTIYKNSGSHGCINLPKDKAAALYNLINKGTIVVVHY